jgi:hypothetical protein
VRDEWGDEIVATANESLAGAELAVPDQPLSPPVHCRHCGAWHSTCDEQAVDLRWAYIRAQARDRLERTESALRLMSEIDRVSTARWLQGVLDRPPLANNRAFEYLRELLDALWRDIYWTTPDALSPTIDYGGERWFVPEPHHELAEMREGEFVEP